MSIKTKEFSSYTKHTTTLPLPLHNNREITSDDIKEVTASIYLELPPQRQLIEWTGLIDSNQYRVKFHLPLPWVGFGFMFTSMDDSYILQGTHCLAPKYGFRSSKINNANEPHTAIIGGLPNIYSNGTTCFGDNELPALKRDDSNLKVENIVNIFYSSGFNRELFDDLMHNKFWCYLAANTNEEPKNVLKIFQYWESLELKDVCDIVEEIQKQYIHPDDSLNINIGKSILLYNERNLYLEWGNR